MSSDDLELIEDKELKEKILYDAIEDELNSSKKEKRINKTKKTTKKSKKSVSLRLKNGLKVRTVLLLLLTLLVNTYAWFIYVSTVSSSMDIHIKSWEFELSNGEQNEDFTFTVEQIYPGMPDATQEITARNKGESEAKLICEVKSVTILDETYSVGDQYEENGVIKEFTAEDLLNKIMNDYPFKIQIYLNDVLYDGLETIMQTGDTTIIKFEVVWPYETGDTDLQIDNNDIIDTQWGKAAYEFYEDGGDKYCIRVDLHIEAVQAEGEENNP